VPLPLYGTARLVRTDAHDNRRQVLRLCNPGAGPVASEDAALIKSLEESRRAVSSGFRKAWVVGDNCPVHLMPAALQTTYCVSERYDYMAAGDLIGVEAVEGRFGVHYRRSSAHNSFLVTDRCNHYCLMCSQPPKDVDDRWILKEIGACLPLIDRTTSSLGFTGGEPLLEWRDFIGVLERCRDVLPDTAIHVLSNGRAFADSRVVAAWTGVKHPNLMVGIPIYSAVDNVHDYVVQAAGAFDETVLGILKLKDRGGRIEIRVVLHSITAPRLVETSRWIARNLPFVDHVALMGLENTGFAIANDALLWIDPVD
jgi:His-Xaa-Ser system radical SAM maturase HxsC